MNSENPKGALTVREHFDKEARENGGQTFDERMEDNETLREKIECDPSERAPEGEEVFARSEIPFEVALEVVRKKMSEGMLKIKAKGHQYAWLSLSGVIFPNSNMPEFDFHASGDDDWREDGKDLSSMLTDIPALQTESDKKARRMEALRAELAELEKSGVQS